MTGLDIFAASCAMTSSVALGLRANMLKPHVNSWFTAPTAIWLLLMLLSVALAVAAISIVRTGGTTGRELIVYVASALSSVAMLINLVRQPLDGEGDVTAAAPTADQPKG